MRLLRVLFDVAAFALPARFPALLVAYAGVHFFAPHALRWPRRLDAIDVAWNVYIKRPARCSDEAKL